MSIYVYCLGGAEGGRAIVKAQRRRAETYCVKLGPRIDATYIDADLSGKKSLSQRPAGRELMDDLKRGDHLVVARLESIWRSFVDFAAIVDQLSKKGVVLHLVDFPFGVLDPEVPSSQMIVHIIRSFAESQRESASRQISKGMRARRKRGERFNGRAPLGWKYERAEGVDKVQTEFYVMVEDEDERVLMSKALELYTDGYTLDQIRQYFNYEWKVRTRTGREWSLEGISHLVKAADRLELNLSEVAEEITTNDFVNSS